MGSEERCRERLSKRLPIWSQQAVDGSPTHLERKDEDREPVKPVGHGSFRKVKPLLDAAQAGADATAVEPDQEW